MGKRKRVLRNPGKFAQKYGAIFANKFFSWRKGVASTVLDNISKDEAADPGDDPESTEGKVEDEKIEKKTPKRTKAPRTSSTKKTTKTKPSKTRTRKTQKDS